MHHCIGHSESFEKNASSLLQGFVWVNSQESSSVEQIVHRVAVKFNSLEQSIAFILRSCHNVPEMRQKIVGAKLGSNPDRLALSATPWSMTLLSGLNSNIRLDLQKGPKNIKTGHFC